MTIAPRQHFHTNDVVQVVVLVPPTTPYNLQPNESGQMGGYGYVTHIDGTAVSQDTGPGHGARLLFTTVPVGAQNYFTTESFGVTPGHYVSASWRARDAWSAGRIEFKDATGEILEFTATAGPDDDTLTVTPYEVPAGATSARLRIYVYEPGGGFVTTTLEHTFDRVRIATAADPDDLDLTALTPYLPVTVSGSVVDMKASRSPLDVNQLELLMLSDDLDPAIDDVLAQGNVCQFIAGGSVTVYTGRILDAKTTYNLQAQVGKRARIVMTVVDATSKLAQHVRPDGVATIDELPTVVEGCGVPWVVNGSTAQTNDSVIVARNESATAVDQVAVTRDSVHGYAWVDTFDRLIAADADHMPADPVAIIDETVYRPDGIDVGFDRATVINEVVVRMRRINTGTLETEEITLGPYRDQASIDKWGARRPSSDFVVQGLDEDAVADFAAAVLAANATPRVRVRSVTFPIRTLDDVYAYAGVDLYQLATVRNEGRGIDEDLRITKIDHTISSRVWTVTWTFEDTGQVAQPQATPALPSTGHGKTTAELYRPVGEITMWMGDSTEIPAGWLRCNGSAFDGGTYPVLAALLGGTVTPNLVDRFPIGAGTKALGSSGGSPDAALTLTKQLNTAIGGASTRVTDVTTPVDVLNPWRAVHFIIRAA